MSAAVQLAASGAPPAPDEALRAEVRSELDGVREEWRALNDAAAAGTMFSGPEWLEAWWQHFGAPAGRALRLVCVREGARLVGVLPLFEERVRVGGAWLLRLAFVGDGATGCDRLDALAAPGREAEVLDACLEELFRLEWDLLDLDGLDRDSPTVLALAERFAAGRATGGCVRDGRLRFVCPHLPLRGTYETLLEGMSRRENLRRREKWLFKQPGVRVELDRSAASLDTFFALHDARWAAAGGSDGLPDERFKPFHRDACAALAASGKLRFFTLFAARRPVASVYGVVHNGIFNYYQSGYQPLWGNKSVGLVLLSRAVQAAYAEGLRDFDFLRGREAYKSDWARGERWTVQLRIFRGARGRAARLAERLSSGARAAAKAALPGDSLARLRSLRRALRSKSGAIDLVRSLVEGESAQCALEGGGT